MTTHKAETKKILFWVWLIGLLPTFAYITGLAGFINDTIQTTFFGATNDILTPTTGSIRDFYTMFQDNVLHQIIPTDTTIILPLSGTLANDFMLNFLSAVDFFFFSTSIFDAAFLNSGGLTVNDVIIMTFFRIIPAIIILYLFFLLIFARDQFFDGPGNFSSIQAFLFESMLMRVIFFFLYFSFFLGTNNGGITLIKLEKVEKNADGTYPTITNADSEEVEVKIVFSKATGVDFTRDDSTEDSAKYKVPNVIYYLFKFITSLAFSLDGKVLENDPITNTEISTLKSGIDYYPITFDFWNEWIYNNYLNNSVDLTLNPVKVSNQFIIGLLLENKKDEYNTMKLQCLIKRKQISEHAFLEAKYIPPSLYFNQSYNKKIQEKAIKEMTRVIDAAGELDVDGSGLDLSNPESYRQQQKTLESLDPEKGNYSPTNFLCKKNPFTKITERQENLMLKSPYMFGVRTRNYLCINDKKEHILSMKKGEVEILKEKLDLLMLEETPSTFQTFDKTIKLDIPDPCTSSHPKVLIESYVKSPKEKFWNIYTDSFTKVKKPTGQGTVRSACIEKNNTKYETIFSKTMVSTVKHILMDYKGVNEFGPEFYEILKLLSGKEKVEYNDYGSSGEVNREVVLANYKHILNTYLNVSFGNILSKKWFELNKRVIEETLKEEQEIIEKGNKSSLTSYLGGKKIINTYFNLAFGYPVEKFTNEKDVWNRQTSSETYTKNETVNEELDLLTTLDKTLIDSYNKTKILTNQNMLHYMLTSWNKGNEKVYKLTKPFEGLKSINVNLLYEEGKDSNEISKIGSSLYYGTKNKKTITNMVSKLIDGSTPTTFEPNMLTELFIGTYSDTKIKNSKTLCDKDNTTTTSSNLKGEYGDLDSWNNLIVDTIDITLENEVDFCKEYNKTTNTPEPPLDKRIEEFQYVFKEALKELKTSLESYNYINNYLSPLTDLLLFEEMVLNQKRLPVTRIDAGEKSVNQANYPNINVDDSDTGIETKLKIPNITLGKNTLQTQESAGSENQYKYYNLKGSNVFFLPEIKTEDVDGNQTIEQILMVKEELTYEKEKLKKLKILKTNLGDETYSELINLLIKYSSFLENGYISSSGDLTIKDFKTLNEYMELINSLKLYLSKYEGDLNTIVENTEIELSWLEKLKQIIKGNFTHNEVFPPSGNKSFNRIKLLQQIISLQLAKYKDFYIKYNNYLEIQELFEDSIIKDTDNDYVYNYFNILSIGDKSGNNTFSKILQSISNRTHYKITNINEMGLSEKSDTYDTEKDLYEVEKTTTNQKEKIKVNTGKLYDNITGINADREVVVLQQSTNYKKHVIPEIKNRLKEVVIDETSVSSMISKKIKEIKGYFTKLLDSPELITKLQEQIAKAITDNVVYQLIINSLDELTDLLTTSFNYLKTMSENDSLTESSNEMAFVISALLNQFFSMLDELIKELFIMEEPKKGVESYYDQNTTLNPIEIPEGMSFSTAGIVDIEGLSPDETIGAIDRALSKLKNLEKLDVIDIMINGEASLETCSLKEEGVSFLSQDRGIMKIISTKIFLYVTFSFLEEGLKFISELPYITFKIQALTILAAYAVKIIKFLFIWQLLTIGFALLILFYLCVLTFKEMAFFVVRYILKPLIMILITTYQIIKKLLYDYVKELVILVYKIIVSLANPEHIGKEVAKIDNDILNIKLLLDFIGNKVITIVISLLTVSFAIFIYYMSALVYSIFISGEVFELIITTKVFNPLYILPFTVVGSYWLVFKTMNLLYGLFGDFINREEKR